MVELELLTVATHPTATFCNLASSAVRWGHTLRVLGWRNQSTSRQPFVVASAKMDVLSAFFGGGGGGSRRGPSQLYIFLDGYDSLVQSHPHEVLSRLRAYKPEAASGSDVLFSGEGYCAPETLGASGSACVDHYRDVVPPLPQGKVPCWKKSKSILSRGMAGEQLCAPGPPWSRTALEHPFLNLGMFVGTARALRRMVEACAPPRIQTRDRHTAAMRQAPSLTPVQPLALQQQTQTPRPASCVESGRARARASLTRESFM